MRSRRGPVNGHPLWRGYNCACMFHVEHIRRPGKACLPRGHSDHKRRAAPHASADSRSPARAPPWNARPLRGRLRSCRPRRAGLQPADTPRPRRSPPPTIWRPTAFPPDTAALGVFRVETDSRVVGGYGSCDQRIVRRKTRTQEGFTWLTHSSRISGPSPVWVATGLWMADPRTGTARAKMAWASGIKPAF